MKIYIVTKTISDSYDDFLNVETYPFLDEKEAKQKFSEECQRALSDAQDMDNSNYGHQYEVDVAKYNENNISYSRIGSDCNYKIDEKLHFHHI